MPVTSESTKAAITEAVRVRLLSDGYAKLSTRAVAAEAGVPLSQLHYHFGSKAGLVMAALEAENERRLERQRLMYAEPTRLSERYDQACDFLEDDLDSGYVRLLQEMIAAGWSDSEIATLVRTMLWGWADLLLEVTEDAERRFGPLGPFTAEEITMLVQTAFLGAEALLLLGYDRRNDVIRSALRRVADLIRAAEAAEAATATAGGA